MIRHPSSSWERHWEPSTVSPTTIGTSTPNSATSFRSGQQRGVSRRKVGIPFGQWEISHANPWFGHLNLHLWIFTFPPHFYCCLGYLNFFFFSTVYKSSFCSIHISLFLIYENKIWTFSENLILFIFFHMYFYLCVLKSLSLNHTRLPCMDKCFLAQRLCMLFTYLCMHSQSLSRV